MSDEALQAAPVASQPTKRGGFSRVAAWAFDLDGTLILGHQALPGAVDLIAALDRAQVPFLYATNNSSKSKAQYLSELRACGLVAREETVLTSNDVALQTLKSQRHRRVLALCTPAVADEYRRHGLELVDLDATSAPDAVLLTFDTTISYPKLRAATRWIRAGVPFYATNPDLLCPTPDGPIPDCGSFAALLLASTEMLPTVVGKPNGPMAAAICDRLGLPPSSIAFVGDRLYTDVRMANEHRFLSVLTLTGEAGLAGLSESEYRPDVVVADMLELSTHLEGL
jgi:HAD superfamily hydrolase (TIGR01450 family)